MMREEYGNIWDYHERGCWIAITTNGFVNGNGLNPMGRGIALQAARRFPSFSQELGARIRESGNHVYPFPEYRLFSFPVKQHWRPMALLSLITQSCVELVALVDQMQLAEVAIVRPGCGAGKMLWPNVRPICEMYFDGRFVVVEKEKAIQEREPFKR